MSADEAPDDRGLAGAPAAVAEFPEEGMLAHVAPLELVARLCGLEFTGRLVFYVGAVEGELGFYEGSVVDARALGDFGVDALYRMLGATVGTYKIDRRISTSAPPQQFNSWAELRRGYDRHRHQLAHLAEAAGGMGKIWGLRYGALHEYLHDLPDTINPLLRRLDGRRTVAQVITETPLGETTSVRALAKLLRLGLLVLPDAPAVQEVSGGSPIARTLDGGRVAEIGSDVPVDAGWFDEAAVAREKAREEQRRGVLEGLLTPTAPQPEPVIPAADPLRSADPPAEADTIPEAPAAAKGAVTEPVVPASARDEPPSTGAAQPPAGEPQAGEAQAGEAPAGEAQAGEAQAGEAQAGEAQLEEPHVSDSQSELPVVAGTLDNPRVTDPRPLPAPLDLVDAAPLGEPSGVDVATWSTQGEPPPAPVVDDELELWLGHEDEFFEAPPEERDREVHHRTAPVPEEPRAPLFVRVVVGALLLVVGALIGTSSVRGCGPVATAEKLERAIAPRYRRRMSKAPVRKRRSLTDQLDDALTLPSRPPTLRQPARPPSS